MNKSLENFNFPYVESDKMPFATAGPSFQLSIKWSGRGLYELQSIDWGIWRKIAVLTLCIMWFLTDFLRYWGPTLCIASNNVSSKGKLELHISSLFKISLSLRSPANASLKSSNFKIAGASKLLGSKWNIGDGAKTVILSILQNRINLTKDVLGQTLLFKLLVNGQRRPLPAKFVYLFNREQNIWRRGWRIHFGMVHRQRHIKSP